MNNIVYSIQQLITCFILDRWGHLYFSPENILHVGRGSRPTRSRFFFLNGCLPGGPKWQILSNTVSTRPYCLWAPFMLYSIHFQGHEPTTNSQHPGSGPGLSEINISMKPFAECLGGWMRVLEAEMKYMDAWDPESIWGSGPLSLSASTVRRWLTPTSCQ